MNRQDIANINAAKRYREADIPGIAYRMVHGVRGGRKKALAELQATQIVIAKLEKVLSKLIAQNRPDMASHIELGKAKISYMNRLAQELRGLLGV